MDIDSLYTNIDISEAIQAGKNIFFKYPDSKRLEKELLQLLHINITRNDFDNKFFLQIKGTAMGKKLSSVNFNQFNQLITSPKSLTVGLCYLAHFAQDWTLIPGSGDIGLHTLLAIR